MPFRAHGPEPCASAYSATRARPTGMGSRERVQAGSAEPAAEPKGARAALGPATAEPARREVASSGGLAAEIRGFP